MMGETRQPVFLSTPTFSNDEEAVQHRRNEDEVGRRGIYHLDRLRREEGEGASRRIVHHGEGVGTCHGIRRGEGVVSTWRTARREVTRG